MAASNPLREVIHIICLPERRKWDLLLECGHEVTRYMPGREEAIVALLFGRLDVDRLTAPKRCRCPLCGNGISACSKGQIERRIRQREAQGA